MKGGTRQNNTRKVFTVVIYIESLQDIFLKCFAVRNLVTSLWQSEVHDHFYSLYVPHEKGVCPIVTVGAGFKMKDPATKLNGAKGCHAADDLAVVRNITPPPDSKALLTRGADVRKMYEQGHKQLSMWSGCCTCFFPDVPSQKATESVIFCNTCIGWNSTPPTYILFQTAIK